MVAFPPCKINLGLHIVNKRADGYHNLETCFYPVPWTDILEIIPANTVEFISSGNTIPGNLNDNLCLRAYQLLKNDVDLPAVKIHLHKIIPTGAGLGGGSSDAAYTLRLLNSIFNLQLPTETLLHYAATLGSDCAFFLQDQPTIGTGRGEILSPVNLKLTGKFLVIIKPDIHISTAEAYAGITPRVQAIRLEEILHQPLHTWNELLVNDFEKSIFPQHPILASIKNEFYQHGAIYACMSGSGSSMIGLFEKNIDLTVFSNPVSWSGLL